MTHFTRILLAAALCGALTACGSGGNAPAPAPEKLPGFLPLVKRGEGLVTSIRVANTEPLSIPDTGRATYRGVTMILKDEPFLEDLINGSRIPADDLAPHYMSELALTADFSDGNLTGRADKFVDHRNKAHPGHVDIDGRVNRDYGSFSGVLVGEVGSDRVNGTMEGGFSGRNASHLIGTLQGNVGSASTFEGFFIARQ